MSLAEEVLEILRRWRKDMPWMPPVMTQDEIDQWEEQKENGHQPLEDR